MSMQNEVELYGSKDCHKTRYYMSQLEKYKIAYRFFDVLVNDIYAEKLKSMYAGRKLNFPTVLIGNKKLRNPSDFELNKWLVKKDIIKM